MQTRWSPQVLTLALTVVTLGMGADPAALALVTSDGFGTHVTIDNVPIDLSHRFPTPPPLLDHDSVGLLEFTRPDFGLTSCSSSLINTPLGPAALIAAHCVVNSAGQMLATDFALTVLDSFGSQETYTTSNPNNVYVHPNYDGCATHGYDLAVVFFDQAISIFVPKYDVWGGSGPGPIDEDRHVIKFGFGQTGDGYVGGISLDGNKRWGLNSYERYGLGDTGAPTHCGWNNLETQLIHDFDDGSFIEHNLFNFYENFQGTLLMPSPSLYGGGTTGWGTDEVFGDNGDSGGPNFMLDEEQGRWVIVGVNSYRYSLPDDFLGYSGNSDIDPPPSGAKSTFGEYEGDALVTEELIEQVLGLAPSPPIGKPFGPVDPSIQGGALGSARFVD